MSGKIRIVVVAAGLALLALSPRGALVSAQTGHEGHGAAPAAAPGVVIRESQVQGATLVYRLYSWDERNVMMKGMEGHEMPGMDSTGASTHHLMVFIKGADGKYLSGGKVGFIVSGAGKTEFKTLTMGMFDGYGADLPLKGKGSFTIKTKAVFADRTLTEEFVHTVK